MKRWVKKNFLSLVLSVAGLLAPASLRAQFLGYTSAQTTSFTPFNAASCTGSIQTATVPNAGQAVHIALAQAGSVKNLLMWFQGSNDGVNYFDISEQVTSQGTTAAAVQGNGYFAVVRLVANCTAGGSITAFYTGQSVTPGNLYGLFASSQYLKNVVLNQPAATGFTGPIFRTPFANTAGTLFAYFAGGTTAVGTNIQVICSQVSSLTPNYQAGVYSLASNTTLQTFAVPASSCPYIELIYNGTAGPTALFTADYVFSLPGVAPGLGTGTYTHITGTTATAIKGVAGFLHTVTVNTGGAGTISVFDLPTASCTGTPATNIVAVATATATTLQTFTYDVNLLQGICVKASVAMDFTVSSN